MTHKGGSGPSLPYIPGQSGKGGRFEYAGEGTYDDPYQFFYHSGSTGVNIAAATTVCSVLADKTLVGCRIKKVHLVLDGATATALNASARVYVSTTNSSGTSIPFLPCEPALFVPQQGGYTDGHTWDFGESGVVLLRGESDNFDGAWQGTMSVQVSGYAATDDFYLMVEGEWWYL